MNKTERKRVWRILLIRIIPNQTFNYWVTFSRGQRERQYIPTPSSLNRVLALLTKGSEK